MTKIPVIPMFLAFIKCKNRLKMSEGDKRSLQREDQSTKSFSHSTAVVIHEFQRRVGFG